MTSETKTRGASWSSLPRPRLVMATVLLALWLMPQSSSADPASVARDFFQHLVRGEIDAAAMLVTAADRRMDNPIGAYSNLMLSRPLLPSLWQVSATHDRDEGERTHVSVNFVHPAIEELANHGGAIALTPEFLAQYLNRDVPLSERSVLVELVKDPDGAWRVFSDAESIAWRMATRYPPAIDYADPARSGVEAYRAELLADFPNRVEEIDALVQPLVATVSAIANLRFSSVEVVLDSPRWREGIYEIKVVIENNSEFTVLNLEVVATILNGSGQIVESDDSYVISSSTLPQGLAAGKQMIHRFPLRPMNPEEAPIAAEIVVKKLEAR